MENGKIELKKKFTDEELADLRAGFDSFDTDGNGALDVNEVTSFFKDIDFPVELVPCMMRIFDTDKNGTISFDEFCDFFHQLMRIETDPDAIARILFEAMDTDKSGTLSNEEITDFLSLLGFKDVDVSDLTAKGEATFEDLKKALGL
ncbi:EF hand family protein [Histomonas meleagridis]|uniref:EF hand family protein n=1 Tax=Histomonas meleagridis TaxID=135588 RepID=UPI0035595392|nr:EF hand family protein [Histomonas meleagridis]KAH0801491.1 EF hand family protein [Histomonas meleagridis]